MTASPAFHRSRSVGRTPAASPREFRRVQLDDDDETIMTKGPEGVVRKLKDRLRAICKRRRIRLQEFFEQFDVHHIKKVSEGQFRRALDQAGVTVSTTGGGPPVELLAAKEVEILIKRYRVKREGSGGESDVNYGKLCEQVEKVFTRRGLEKNPTLDVKLSLENCPEFKYGVSHPRLSSGEAVVVQGLLSRMRIFVAAEGLIVKTLFETFDKRRSGTVTASIFRRQLDSMFKGKLSKTEARLLLRAYQTWDGAANYRAMHNDCSDDIHVAATTESAPAPLVTENEHHRPSQKGELSPSPAISSLGAGVRHSPCGDTDSNVSSATGFSPDRPKVPGPGAEGTWGRDKKEAGPAAVTTRDRWLPIERQMASKVAYHRLRPEDAYAPYDYNHSGSVTRAVFRRGLADAFRISFSEAQLDELEERYWSKGDQVDFRRMCEHIHAISRSAVFVESRIEEEDDPEMAIVKSAIEEIRATLNRRRVSLRQEFYDFDRRGEGHVSVGQLKRVLCSSGVLPINPRTLQLLVKRYATADDPRHPHGQFVDYRRIFEDLGEAYGGSVPVRVDRSPRLADRGMGPCAEPATEATGTNQSYSCGDYCVGSRSVGDSDTSAGPSQLRIFGRSTCLGRPPVAYSSTRTVNMTSSMVLGRERDRSAEELMLHLKAFAFRSSLRTMEFFRSDDPRRSGTMARDKFGRCLLIMGFRLSPVELDTLCDAYTDESLQDAGRVPFVRYARLLEDVDFVFGVRGLERKPECDVNASVEAAKDSFISKSAASQAPGVPPLSAEENAVVMETLRELGAKVRRHRLSLYPVLHDFDRFNRGAIPRTAFERALSQIGILPGRNKTRLLQRKFAEGFTSPDSRADVNYKVFLAALDMVVSGPHQMSDQTLFGGASDDTVHEAHSCVDGGTDGEGAAKRSAEPVTATLDRIEDRARVVTSGSGRVGGSSLRACVREVARQLAVGLVDITNFLSDSGRLRQGDVSPSKLKVAFALAGVSLTEEEFRTLEHGFKSDRNVDMVDWKRFATAVIKAGGVDTDAKAARSCDEVPRYPFVASTAMDEARNEASQQRQQQQQWDQSVAPKDGASDVGLRGHDNCCGRRTRNPKTVQRPPILAANAAAAATTTVAAAAAEEEEEEDVEAGTMSDEGRRVQRAGEGDNGVDSEVLQSALDAIRHRVKHHRVHLKPFFQIFDKNRRRKITRAQFLSVLSNMHFSLTGHEREAICRKYSAHERSPGVRVLYDAFCDDIDPEDPRS